MRKYRDREYLHRRLSMNSLCIKNLRGLALFFSFMAAYASWPVTAQTEFGIRANSADLQNEYQKELDKWMLQAYEGDRDAQFKVGVLFSSDQFNSADEEQAVYWYTQAARQGHVLAQFNLGHHFLTGEGVQRDENTAMNWWLKAAQQDHALAAFNVGRAYYLGIGLKEDHTLARYWFERAAQNREPKSIEILEKLGWAKKGQYVAADTPVAPPKSATSAIANNSETPAFGASSSSVIESAAASVATPNATSNEPQTIASIDAEENDSLGQNVIVSSAAVEQAAAQTETATTEVKHPLAIYTDPAKRSVLVTILDDRDGIEIVSQDDDWVVVTRDAGLPVWVHENFIKIDGDRGDITGSNVNARSVPLIASGTVVGQLNKGERVVVLDTQNEWYRVQSPTRFRGWSKTGDFNAKPSVSVSTGSVEASSPQASITTAIETDSNTGTIIESASSATTKPAVTSTTKKFDVTDIGDTNVWLFSQAPESYTLQLASFDDPAKSKEFESRKKFEDDPKLRRFISNNNGIEWIYYLYGSYSDRSVAESDRERIKQNRAWIRSFGRLQQNRCLAWKKQVPAPRELNTYCVQ